MPGSLTAEDVEQFIRDGFIRLEAAFPRPNVGTFPIRFPSAEDPGDAGWHIDGSYKVGDRVVSHLPQLHDRPLAWATGHAGDVYLCHPFIVHAATWPHRGGLGLG